MCGNHKANICSKMEVSNVDCDSELQRIHRLFMHGNNNYGMMWKQKRIL